MAASSQAPAAHASAAASRPALRDAGRPRRPDPRAGHRRGDDAGLPDVDLRAEGPGRAQRLRVLAHAEPDALRAGGEPGRARGRRVGPVLQLGPGRLDGGAVAAVGGRRGRGRRRPLRRHLPALRQGLPAAGPDLRLRRRARPGRRRGGDHARAPSCAGSRRPRTRCCIWPTSARRARLPRARRPAGRRQHLHEPVLPAPARAGRRPGGALDDQVPERPLRRRRAAP